MSDLKVHTLFHSSDESCVCRGLELDEESVIVHDAVIPLGDQHLHVIVWEPRPKPLPTFLEEAKKYCETVGPYGTYDAELYQKLYAAYRREKGEL